MEIGAFVSTAGGLVKALDRARAMDADSLMLFATSPRSWQRRVFPEEEVAAFRHRFRSDGFRSLWIHGSYLMNFGSTDPAAVRRSTDCLIREAADCQRLGGRGVIFHLGSHGGRSFDAVRDKIITALETVLRETKEVGIVLENATGMGSAIGSRLEELASLYRAVSDPRLQFCLDTQHAFAAGYPIHEKAGLTEYLDQVDKQFGRDRLVVLHANDSKVPFGAKRDRHENIGDGQIGEAGFRVLTHDPRLRGRPFLLEVPGLQGEGPDKPNVDRLRRVAQN